MKSWILMNQNHLPGLLNVNCFYKLSRIFSVFFFFLLQVSLPAVLRRRPPAVRPLGLQHRSPPSARHQEGQNRATQRGGVDRITVPTTKDPTESEKLRSCVSWASSGSSEMALVFLKPSQRHLPVGGILFFINRMKTLELESRHGVFFTCFFFFFLLLLFWVQTLKWAMVLYCGSCDSCVMWQQPKEIEKREREEKKSEKDGVIFLEGGSCFWLI